MAQHVGKAEVQLWKVKASVQSRCGGDLSTWTQEAGTAPVSVDWSVAARTLARPERHLLSAVVGFHQSVGETEQDYKEGRENQGWSGTYDRE